MKKNQWEEDEEYEIPWKELTEFIRKTNTIWDINYLDVAGYILENKEELIKILSK
jgi:hypothetical protein